MYQPDKIFRYRNSMIGTRFSGHKIVYRQKTKIRKHTHYITYNKSKSFAQYLINTILFVILIIY